MSIRIVTDSTSDLPQEFVDSLGITVVPLSILFGDEELRDGVEITSEQFFKRLVRESAVPTTTQPSSGMFHEAYRQLAADGATGILSIHLSSKLSGTLESARQGAEGISVPVRHVDSRQVSLGIAMAIIEAARAIEAGVALEQSAAVAEDTCRRTSIFFTLETLEYLRRGGRMSRGQELIGSLLKVKPILTFEDGEAVAISRIRTKPKAIEDIINRCAELRPVVYSFAVHATTPDELDYLGSRLRGIAPDAKQMTSRLGPVLGVHGGPGTVGCGVVRAPDERSPTFLPQ